MPKAAKTYADLWTFYAVIFSIKDNSYFCHRNIFYLARGLWYVIRDIIFLSFFDYPGLSGVGLFLEFVRKCRSSEADNSPNRPAPVGLTVEIPHSAPSRTYQGNTILIYYFIILLSF